MRRVHVRTGLKQRINAILGEDSGSNNAYGTPQITEWSIQAAMLENMRRIGKALLADSANGCGRPLKGLNINSNYGYTINVFKGFGVTNNGDIAFLDSDTVVSVSSDPSYIYLQYKEAALDGDTDASGKKTSFIGKTGSENIVYDNDNTASVIAVSAPITDNNDLIYLGSTDGAPPNLITNNPDRGFPSSVSGESYFYNLICMADATFNGDINITNPDSRIIVDGDDAYNSTYTVTEGSVLTFKKGILISIA
jgi:hypothetical protein